MRPAQPADVISAGPRRVSSRVVWLMAVVLLAAALTGAVILAVHYGGEAAALRRQLRSVRVPASPGTAPPTLYSDTTALPSSGTLAGEVTVFAVRSSVGQTQVIVTARISGGRPRARYELFGGDCAGNAAAHSWAAGVTDARGSADLTGHVWRVSVGDLYSLIVGSPGMYQNHPGPAVHGYFGTAHGLSAVQDGVAPCAP